MASSFAAPSSSLGQEDVLEDLDDDDDLAYGQFMTPPMSQDTMMDIDATFSEDDLDDMEDFSNLAAAAAAAAHPANRLTVLPLGTLMTGTAPPPRGPLVFNPSAASSSNSRSPVREASSRHDEMALTLGRTGTAGRGLYVVLFADDIHSNSQLLDALREFFGSSNLYTDTLLSKLIRALRQYGHLVVWGTMEMVAECGATQVHLWLDGDQVASTRIGAVALDRANRLSRHGLFCSILTRDELVIEQRAVYVLQWLSVVARSCDPLCQTVAECILPNRHLVPLLRADFKMNARVTKAWYSLLLTLLAVPTFKSHLAAAYCDTYRNVTAKYARGMGVLERSGYTLSVQFLNRVAYVVDLVQSRDLLGKLGRSILETLLVAAMKEHRNYLLRPSNTNYNNNSNIRLNPNHPVLTHRRYSPCVSDLKCVLNVRGMPRVFACERATFLEDWVQSLSVSQLMDPQVWRNWKQGHVENESRAWVSAFNASISLGSLFERLLGWNDDDPSPISDPASPYASGLLTCVETTFRILTRGVARWQRMETINYHPTPYNPDKELHEQCPCSLPFSTIAAKKGTALAMRHLPVSQSTPFSFHLPLYRFVSSCLRELCLRSNDADFGMIALKRMLKESLPERELDELFRGLMDFPVLVLSRAAQVRAGLWRRNGPGLNDQVLNYAEPPFCRTMRDSDLLMIQFAVLGRTMGQSNGDTDRPESDVGMAFFIHLLLHRLGLFEFLGLAKAPDMDRTRYQEEISRGWYARELSVGSDSGAVAESEQKGDEEDEMPLPWTYSPARDSASSLLLLEEFLHTVIIFSTELPLETPSDRAVHTRQAQWKLHREVIHRLASGPKTHSELSEVQHVLSHWDNLLLSEEGKMINPDDAAGAALGIVLNEIAELKGSRGRLEPDKWELKRPAWDSYDPAFFHISLRNHQTAAEHRPKPRPDSLEAFGWKARPYVPEPAASHPYFARLRRDASADAAVMATTYRVLHLHCREESSKELTELRGKTAYMSKEKSETALARAVHVLTLGAYAWQQASSNDSCWREKGGGSVGSVFFDWKDMYLAPTASDWLKRTLLAPPGDLVDCDWFENEECGLILLRRLAVSGGVAGGFIAQDAAVRCGAAWLCDFAVKVSTEAAALVGPAKGAKESMNDADSGESELERRKRLAREKAMAKMKAQAAKFASMIEVDDVDDDTDRQSQTDSIIPSTPVGASRAESVCSAYSSASSVRSNSFSDAGGGPTVPGLSNTDGDQDFIPPRLLRIRPRCIICNDEETTETRSLENEVGEGQRKKSRRRTENALGFVGYGQASTVLKGGGGPPPDCNSPLASVSEFVGTHVALCGHAVHSECCESYLATVSHREDRPIGKRDEFRCPLCQRLSNCLVPFIDVGVDWIDMPSSLPEEIESPSKSEDDGPESMQLDTTIEGSATLHNFLGSTPWWVARHNESVIWDEQSAFVGRETEEVPDDQSPTKRPPRRRMVRSLKKKDLYAAWNAMMRTPRFVRRRLRPRLSGAADNAASRVQDLTLNPPMDEESTGETLVWRRFMDQVSDIGYRADGKRLGDDRLHDYFGEFRHYIVEKYAYNMANRFSGSSPVDWPSCMFTEALSDTRRQELSREKLLSKLLMTVQSFTYSSCCEAFDAIRSYRKTVSSFSRDVAMLNLDASTESVLSKYGMSGVACDWKLLVMPLPSSEQDDGSQPFDGRLGKLRYMALATMAAAGAVAADLVQLVLQFPCRKKCPATSMDVEKCERSPVVFPVLFGHVLTHVTAAMCATCGRGRACSDSLDLVWPLPFSQQGSFAISDNQLSQTKVDNVMEDCESFLKLGMLARLLQVLLGKLNVPPTGFASPSTALAALHMVTETIDNGVSSSEAAWIKACLKLVQLGVSNQSDNPRSPTETLFEIPSLDRLREVCADALSAFTSFLADAGLMLQILVPGVASRFHFNTDLPLSNDPGSTCYETIEKLRLCLKIERLEDILESHHVREIVAGWYDAATCHAKACADPARVDPRQKLRNRLHKTQGFRQFDWPSAGAFDGSIKADVDKTTERISPPQYDAPSPMQIESLRSPRSPASTTAEMCRTLAPAIVSFSSMKTVPLLGGFSPDDSVVKASPRPRIIVLPTSYTDLYSELGSLMPDCEQTAVCLICGEVLNASGKGECTRHSYKCGAGAGMFFLLQECSGLIMHKSKAAYIHSPYVDSHGETPQFRGRPLNLDLARYEHLREIWMGHMIRQTVVAERSSARQVILPDYY